MPEPARSPVLSLVVIDGSTLREGALTEQSKVLVAVRNRMTNPTHPNVVSVPTQRLPRSLFEDMAREHAEVSAVADRQAWVYEGAELDSETDSGHDPVVYAVEALLARKLGLSEALETGEVRFTARLMSRLDGTAIYDELGSTPVGEAISMLSVVVVIPEAWKYLPLATASYSLMSWVPVAHFLNGVRSRDPKEFGERFDPIELCVHGVCLSAAEFTLTAMLDDRLGRRDPARAPHGHDR